MWMECTREQIRNNLLPPPVYTYNDRQEATNKVEEGFHQENTQFIRLALVFVCDPLLSMSPVVRWTSRCKRDRNCRCPKCSVYVLAEVFQGRKKKFRSVCLMFLSMLYINKWCLDENQNVVTRRWWVSDWMIWVDVLCVCSWEGETSTS